MRLPTDAAAAATALVLSLLPTIAFAAGDDQVPLKEKAGGWLDKAKAYVASAAPEIPNPIDAGAAKVAEYKVEKLNIRNYERKLGPKPHGEEEWLIYITGGNKTCHAGCNRADTTWNESVPILTALEPFSGSNLKLATLNCEYEEVLCTAWAAAVPSIFHFIFPQQVSGAQSQAPSPLHDIPLNMSGVVVDDIVSIPRASKSRYLKYDEYTGPFHPIDGTLRKFGLLNTVGYILWGFGSTPSWLFMIAVSFISRQIMARRAGARMDNIRAQQAQGIGVPAGGAGAASGASPAGAAGRGGAKKRK